MYKIQAQGQVSIGSPYNLIDVQKKSLRFFLMGWVEMWLESLKLKECYFSKPYVLRQSLPHS